MNDYEADVFQAVKAGLFTAKAVRDQEVVFAIGDTWNGALYGAVLTNGQLEDARVFLTEDEQTAWFTFMCDATAGPGQKWVGELLGFDRYVTELVTEEEVH